MLTTFIIICVVFCLIAMAAVALPLWFGGRKAADAEDRHETILGILRQQAADLEKEREAGRIDLDEYEESRLELERRVLEETARDTDAEVKDQSKVARIIAVVFAVVIPASAVFGYLALGRYNAMDPAFLEAVQNQQRQTQGHSQSDMMAAIERLQNRLKETPDDAQTWYMLARTLSNVGRFAEALDAFREVDRLVPNNADIIADMADMTAAANNKVITDEARALLQRALKIDPGQWKALALLAIDAWDHEKYAEAAAYWEKLLVVLPEDFGDAQQIRNNIDEARRLAGMDPAARQAEAEAFKGESVPTVQAAEPSFVSGRVTLDKAHADKVKPEDTVFIYARPTTGSKMPVAFMRITAKELPFEFKLTSDMTMAMGATTLADVKDVIVGARISRTGNFMPQAGDLEGETSAPVQTGTEGIDLVIGTVR